MTNKNCLEIFDEFWEDNKYSLSSKLSIGLGFLSGCGSALVGLNLAVPASIVLGCVSMGVFFVGISLSKFSDENQSLKNENRRLTHFQAFPTSQSMTPLQTINNETPKSDISTNTEPYNEVININLNR